MPLELSGAVRETCRKHLIAGLVHAQTGFLRSIVDIGDSDDRVAETIAATFKRKGTAPPWLTRQAIAKFVKDHVDAIVDTERQEFRDVAVQDLPTIRTPEPTADRVLDAMRTLPWTYVVTMPMPLVPAALPEGPILLDDKFTLESYDAEVAAQMPFEDVHDDFTRHFHRERPVRTVADATYLVLRKTGYVRDSDGLEDLREYANAAKGLLGLLNVTHSVRFRRSGHRRPPAAIPVTVYRTDENGAMTAVEYRWFGHDESAALRRFEAKSDWSAYDDPKELLPGVAAAFRDPATRTAARWYFDSITGGESPLQIVQGTVALEILLGDRKESDVIGLRSLIANRLAYMVGHTPARRRAIMTEVKHLYDLRSEIVHAGTSEMDETGQRSLAMLQMYAEMVLSSQISGLADDERSSGTSASG